MPASSWRLRAALLASSVGSSILAFTGQGPEWRWLPAVELLRYGSWLLAVPALIRISPGAWFARINVVLWLLSALVALESPVLGILVLAFAGLVNVEQLLRNARPEEKHGIKLCAISLGAIFAWDLFFFSQFALLEAPDGQAWAIRGLLIAVMLPMLLVGVDRLGSAAPNLFVSRQAMFFSTAFVAVGLYLVAVALAAQYLRSRGGGWADLLSPLLLAGAGVVFAVLLASESPRRRLRVFLAKHFYRNKYDYREEWLRFVATLASPDDGDVRITAVRAIAQIFESPGGALFLHEEGSGTYVLAATWFVEAQSREDLAPLPGDHDLIRFIRQKEWVIDLDEYRRSPAVYGAIGLPPFLRRADTKWRIVSPLFQREELQGFVVLRRPPDPFTMTYEDRDLLKMVGRHVATLLAQHQADQRLAESRQFDAFNRFVAFVMHDLKNSVAQLQLLTSNAARHRHNPEFIDDAFVTIDNTAARITRLISQLQSRDVRAGERQVAIASILEAATARCASQAPQPVVAGAVPPWCVTADPERLTAVFEHVLRNAQDAAGAIGEVRVTVDRTGDQVAVTISDTGSGMDPEFIRDRLFRPFDSTKGASGMGVGAYQARAYVREIGGTVEVRSAPGSGTRFIVRIPLCQTNSHSAS